MFSGATSFNGDLSLWNTGAVTNMKFMFRDASSFNQSLCWDVTEVIFMLGMFDRSNGSFDTNC